MSMTKTVSQILQNNLDVCKKEDFRLCYRKIVCAEVYRLTDPVRVSTDEDPKISIKYLVFKGVNGRNPIISAALERAPKRLVCTNEVGNCGCVHAEQKAVVQLLKCMVIEDRFMLCSTYSPCTNCANLITLVPQIKIVLYAIPTEHDLRGIQILQDAGIKVLTSNLLSNP